MKSNSLRAFGTLLFAIACIQYSQHSFAHIHNQSKDHDHGVVHKHNELQTVELDEFYVALPKDLPERFSIQFPYQEQTLTLEMEKASVFGKNTRFLIGDGRGNLTEVDPGPVRSYLGYIAELPGLPVSAVLSSDGLYASIIQEGGNSIRIEPREVDGKRVHFLSTTVEKDSIRRNDLSFAASEDLTVAAPTDPIVSRLSAAATVSTTSQSSGATLPPSRVMNVYEYEVGVEIGSAALLNNYSGSSVSAKVASATAVAQQIPGNLNARYLRAAGVRHRLGTVIIRTNASEDKFTVRNGNDSSGLRAFRDYWNNNPSVVGSTHDLAVYHVRSAPSGLAYVNTIGTSSRYALTASNGPTSWADGTLAHEFGHTWSLNHTNSGPIVNYNYNAGGSLPSKFYETKPRNNSGSNSSGGNHVFITPMNGNGNHNIGRFATDEANDIYNTRQNKLSFGDLVSNPGPIPPFGHRDIVTATGSAITIDVIANDFDGNNDVLDVQLLDTVSQKGGTITLSSGTGPGGRNQLIYTPPAQASGVDFFHYTVFDTTNRTDWGAVYVKNQGPTRVTLGQSKYLYDVGPAGSAVFTGDTYVGLSDETAGDLGFTSNGPNPVESRDRGASGTNDINRDHVRMRSPGTFYHALSPGVYNILFTVGDKTEGTASIRFTAEGGAATLTTSSHPSGSHTNYTLSNVTVTDGELNVDIENLGFSANINRIIITRVSTLGNLARNKATSQSSTYNSNSVASKANDGDTNGAFPGRSVTHTNNNTNAWWQIDLGAVRNIHDIILWNRTDCCSNRLSNFHVFVSNVPFTSTNLNTTINQSGVSNFYTSGAVGTNKTIGVNRFGRYVRVQLGGSGVLSLAEVEIMGREGAGVTPIAGWYLDAISGNSTPDAGGTHNISLKNSPTTSAGRVQDALRLDGNNDYGDTTTQGLADGATELTISAWVKPDTKQNNEGIFTATGPTYFGLLLSGYGVGNPIEFRAMGKGLRGPNSSVPTGVWTHVVGVWKSGQFQRIYLNGSLAASTSGQSGSVNIDKWIIGRDRLISNRFFDGSIDEVLLYNVALTDQQVQALYNNGY